jgi:haloacetate dehalogenase
MSLDFFPGFDERRIATPEAEIHARIGGSGPPLVCLHGFPQTHVAWRHVAALLAARYTVVVPDLRGYGASEIVASDASHAAYSKRAMARDVIALMGALGFERFAVAGHDRGGRVGYRLALDAPQRVSALATLDIVPTLDTWEAMDYRAAQRTYHWMFLAQPEPLPERLIGADPDYYLDWTIGSWIESDDAIEPEAMQAYRDAFRRPAAIHAACEDYRAGFSVDVENDRADRQAGRRIACPVLALWGGGPTTKNAGFDALGIWRSWANDVRGEAFPCGHFLMEELPARTADALLAFFGQRAH